jgi:hypothetical protein
MPCIHPTVIVDPLAELADVKIAPLSYQFDSANTG